MCDEVGKVYLPLIRPCQVIYTNLGTGGEVDRQLEEAGQGHLTTAHGVIGLHHRRGEDELAFRSVKDFGGEILPFKGFTRMPCITTACCWPISSSGASSRTCVTT